MTFKSDEREQQLRWKNATTTLSSEACAAGLYTGPPARVGRTLKREEMFLHESRTGENLSPTLRTEALAIFRNAGIPWHDASGDGGPSNFLMDSMVSCVNCLLPFAHDGKALAKLLHALVPDAVEALPIEDGRVLTFEWIGEDNPLGETSPKRKRGSHGTSADAYCILKRSDGGCTGILIEWKYTERYLEERRKHGAHYLPLLEAADSPIDLARCGGAETLFVDPLYQLARLQLLAQAVERAPGAVCDRVMLMVIVPDGNHDYRSHVPGTALRERFAGLSLADVWTGLLRRPDRFALTSFDRLLSSFPEDEFPAMVPALGEIRARYGRSL